MPILSVLGYLAMILGILEVQVSQNRPIQPLPGPVSPSKDPLKEPKGFSKSIPSDHSSSTGLLGPPGAAEALVDSGELLAPAFPDLWGGIQRVRASIIKLSISVGSRCVYAYIGIHGR